MTKNFKSASLRESVPTQRMADVSGSAQLVALWLHGKTPKSQKSYDRDVREFFSFLTGQAISQVRLNDVDLRTVTLNDVQAFQDYLESRRPEPKPRAKTKPTGNLTPNAIKRKMASVKSVLRFGCEIGYLQYNVSVPVKLPKTKNTLAERYLTEMEVMTMIALCQNQRDRLLLRLLYLTGARVGEIASLRWRDIKPNRDGLGQVTLFGKGDRTRFVVIKADLYKQLMEYRGKKGENDAVFPSRKTRKPVSARQIHHIVKNCASAANLSKDVSPHWLRHAHATHALDRGTPPQLVQATLGHEDLSTTGKYAHARPNQSSGLDLPG